MGVYRLSTYIKSIPGGVDRIDILLEIEKFKLETDNLQPTIVFDVMGFIHGFIQTNDECALGGRHNKYFELADNFFQTMVELGVQLVFICDGHLPENRIDLWCKRRDSDFRAFRAILSRIDAGQYRCSDAYNNRGTKYFVDGLLKRAKRYGTVIIATERDCDSVIGQYATEHNALAIVASDSDFLIFDGNWQHWEVQNIDMLRFQVNRFNRDALLDDLQLTREQMKVFATIAGNDYTPHSRKEFSKIADFCRPLIPSSSESFYQEIAAYIAADHPSQLDIVDCVKMSIESYDIDFKPPIDVDSLELYVRENVLMHAILNDGIFQYEVNSICFDSMAEQNQNEFSDCDREELLERILDSMRRLAGILLFHKSTDYFKMVTKYSPETNYELKHEQPEYPDVKVPLLRDLILDEEHLDETRWKLLMWCLNFKEDFYKRLLNIPHQLKMVVLTLAYLCETREISLLHADAILVTEYTLGCGNGKNTFKAKKPVAMYGDIVRAAHNYNKTMWLVWDSLVICGLQRFIRHSWYDGYLFHQLYVQFYDCKFIYDRQMQAVESYRLYAQPELFRVEK